ncbi:hypothetical protein A2_6 [Enterococcus phage vB_EfaM_A2]|uniref:Uncharacterized protein n=1 Tax=Enterococcus phage vB_EfaM_A2 TaxID=2767513 RepID=A0A7G9A385_9CAUD|nr:hypothetical protein A2_6 [Enterococcus phage vB_EfaM_A2]
MKILIDTVLYNPSIEVVEVNKVEKFVKVVDLFNDNEIKKLELIQSKQDSYKYYFRMGRRTFWLHNLFDNAERGDKRKSVWEEMQDFNKTMALTGVTRYKDMNDYKQDYETLEEAQADFDEKLADGFIQNITLATYNGATQESTFFELTDENILEAIYTDLHETDSYDMLQEIEENTDLTKWDYIRAYTEVYNVFTLNGLVYIERD